MTTLRVNRPMRSGIRAAPVRLADAWLDCAGLCKEFLIVRPGKEAAERVLARKGTRVFDITGRPMKGWVMVEESALGGKSLSKWVEEAIGFVQGLPRK